jgi:hypothetical protein
VGEREWNQRLRKKTGVRWVSGVNAAVAVRERVENTASGIDGGRIRALQQIHAATHPAEAHATLSAAQRSVAEREGLRAALEADEEAGG